MKMLKMLMIAINATASILFTLQGIMSGTSLSLLGIIALVFCILSFIPSSPLNKLLYCSSSVMLASSFCCNSICISCRHINISGSELSADRGCRYLWSIYFYHLSSYSLLGSLVESMDIDEKIRLVNKPTNPGSDNWRGA